MNAEVRLDPDSLRLRAARLAELGDRVGQTYTGLRDCLAHAEDSWGDDDLGIAFAGEFKPHADQLLANVRAMEDSLHGTAAGIVDAARQFEVQDKYGADRVGATAEDLDSIGVSALSRPGGSAGTPPPTGAQPPVTPDPTSTSPVAGDPAYPTDRTQPAEGSTPGGQRTSNPAAGQRAPEGGRQRPDRSDRAADRGAGRELGRGAGGQSSGTSDKPAAEPGRRPPSSAVFPPAPTRHAPRAQAVASGRQPAAGVGWRDTPWSGRAPRTPGAGQPLRAPGPPAGAEPSPRYGTPPRSDKPSGKPPQGRDQRSSGERPVSNPVVGWLARTLVERHGVRVVGFDTPGLQVPPVREFVAAVDRVLTDYPLITLDTVEVAELGDESGMVRWSSEPSGIPGATRSVALDQRTAQEPRRGTGTTGPGAEPAQLDVYTATLGECGRALDVVGGGLARRQAQRVLIAEYLRLEPGRRRTLAEVVRGYQQWRAELTGDVTVPGGFDVSRALGAAFAEVVQRGDEAGVQAKTLHAVLVGAATLPV